MVVEAERREPQHKCMGLDLELKRIEKHQVSLLVGLP